MMVHTGGSLADTSFIDILKDASRNGVTGMVRAENGTVIKAVYFQKGTISFASSNESSDRLTEVLRRAGKLTPEQVRDAQARVKPNVSLGKTLVELGYIGARDLLWGARAQVDGILHNLMFWKEGKYQVIQGNLPKEIIHLNLSVPSVIFEGIMKTQDRDWVLQHIGSPEAIYATGPEFEDQIREMKLPVYEVGSKLNGQRTLHEIAQSFGIDSFELCKNVVALQFLDLVKPIQDEPLQMSFDEPEAEEPNTPRVENEVIPSELSQIDTENMSSEASLQSSTLSQSGSEPAPSLAVVTVEKESTSSDALANIDQPAPARPEQILREPVQVNERARRRARVGRKKSRYEEFMKKSGFQWKGPFFVVALAVLIAGAGYYFFTRAQPMNAMTEVEPIAQAEAQFEKEHTLSAGPAKEPDVLSDEFEQETGENEAVASEDENPTEPVELSALELLKSGKLPDAARSWQNGLTAQGYSIQVLIACQEKTVIETFQQMNYARELIVLPIIFRGQNCYRVLFGQYPTRQFAEKVMQTLPDAFVQDTSPAAVVRLSRVLL